ncbi:MAG: hypothetical protein HKN10_04500 [Myxococcales bacterium]|nr:hypothetical protein [Myxococcales bacterium]
MTAFLLRVLPLVLAAVVGLVVVDAGFVYDDPSALLENAVVNGTVPVWEAFIRDFWGRPASHGFTSWRPLMPIVWALFWKLWPSNPLPFHILSATLHVLAVAMSMRFVYRLRPSYAWSAAAGTLFALHPLNTEAVSAIVAQADLLSFSLALAACTVALGPASLRAGAVCALLFLLAALVKESAVILAPLAVIFFLMGGREKQYRWRAAAPVVLASMLVVGLQLGLPRAPGVAMITSNLAHQAHGELRLLLGLHNVGRSLLMTVWPWPLAPNHGYAAVELQVGALGPYAAAGGLLLVTGMIGGVWAIRRRRVEWVAALSLVYAPALLQSHWFVPLITDLAERLLYPATLGIAMIVSIGIFAWLNRPEVRALVVASLGTLSLLASLSARRAWVDEDSLWLYAVRAEPRATLHHHNASNTYFRANDLDLGAYHRFIDVYLVDRFPEPVQWEEIESTSSFSARKRFIELPAILEPEDPCRLVRLFTNEAVAYEPLSEYVVEHWGLRYPLCME